LDLLVAESEDEFLSFGVGINGLHGLLDIIDVRHLKSFGGKKLVN
jgi:hypothetical protein